MSALLIAKLAAIGVAALASGVLLGNRAGNRDARKFWEPVEESLDDLARELRLRELRGE
jgi:hypothetical protein